MARRACRWPRQRWGAFLFFSFKKIVFEGFKQARRCRGPARTCFEIQDVSGSKPSDSQGKAKPSRRASVRWRWRWLCRRRGASKVPPRGGVAEVRHCPVPVRCSGWGSVPGSAAPGPVVGRQALVCGAGRRSRRRLGPWEVSWSRRGLLSVPVDAICGSYSASRAPSRDLTSRVTYTR